VDQAFLGAGTGIHPPSPGVPALHHGWGPKARRSTLWLRDPLRRPVEKALALD
jgi:hypothetical protein